MKKIILIPLGCIICFVFCMSYTHENNEFDSVINSDSIFEVSVKDHIDLLARKTNDYGELFITDSTVILATTKHGEINAGKEILLTTNGNILLSQGPNNDIIILGDLPTNCLGKSSGCIYNSNGFLKICP